MRDVKRYSEAFKKQVVMSLEKKERGISEASRVFGCSSVSLYEWIRKYGKDYKIGRIMRIETKTERDRLKELESEVKRLSKENEKMYLKTVALESLIELADEEYKTDLKKNFGSRALIERSKRLLAQGQ